MGLALATSGQSCDDSEDISHAGEDLFATHCSRCHGMDARGAGPEAATLPTRPTDLTRLARSYGTPLPYAELADLIDGRGEEHGGRVMPAFGDRFFADRPEDPKHEETKRIAIGLILGYLDTLQESPGDGRDDA